MPKSDGKRSKKGKGTDKMWNLKIWDDDSQDINPSLWADITVSPIKFKKIKISKDEFQDSYSGVGQSGSEDLFPSQDILPSTASLEADIKPSPKKFKKLNLLNDDSQDIFPSTASLEADIKPRPKKFKKLNLWNDDSQDILDESQDSYSGGPSGSQIFPTQVVEESEDINEDSSEKEGSKNSFTGDVCMSYSYSNFHELQDVMVNIFRRVWHEPLETYYEASRKFLHFCSKVVSHRNEELDEMIEEYQKSRPQQDNSTSGDEQDIPTSEEYNPEEN